jgi:hypothetical protein
MIVASVGRSIIFVSSDSGSGPFIANNREGGSAFGEGLRLTKNSKSLLRPLKSIVSTGRDLRSRVNKNYVLFKANVIH